MNTYEIIDETFIFHSEEEVKEFELSKIIEELEKSGNNSIEVQNGKLKEFIHSDDYYSSEEMQTVEKSAWVNVEMHQIEDVVFNLMAKQPTKVELTNEEIVLIKVLLSEVSFPRSIVYRKEIESIKFKLNN